MLLGVGPDGPIGGRRVAITGRGVVSCCGVGTEALWTGLNGPPMEGERRVLGFDPEVWISAKEARHLDRFAQFSVAVAAMAMEDAATAGDLGADPGRSAVIMGTGVGGLQTLRTRSSSSGRRVPGGFRHASSP